MRHFKCGAIVVLSLLILVLSACGGGKPETQTPGTSASAETETESIPETETETETEKETRASRVELGHREDDPSDEALLEWADSLYNDALQKLAADGYIPPLGEDPEQILEFFVGSGGHYAVKFLNSTAEDMLTGELDEKPDMVIVGTPTAVYHTYYRQVVDQTVPYFFPSTSSNTNVGVLHYGENSEIYADTLDECRYFIYIRPFISHVDEDFYSGGWDRTIVTTVVFIIDAENREVVHIETIGTDVPGTIVSMGEHKGKAKWEEAQAYILALLEEE